MKNALVDLLKGKGFVEGRMDDIRMEGISCQHSFLTLSLEKDVEVAWFGTRSTSLKVDVWTAASAGWTSSRTQAGPLRVVGTTPPGSVPATQSSPRSRMLDLRFERGT